ncbi:MULTISPECIES: hypothetical protein [unclassified Acinetobacter]|uniref:hypothetical protein n=1 Tax=unclassified Acinetobacter TaxID=196816 RepID=UPI00148F4456|nr:MULTISPECIES: hypothetical protein [unclassified Acinetobacter]
MPIHKGPTIFTQNFARIAAIGAFDFITSPKVTANSSFGGYIEIFRETAKLA